MEANMAETRGPNVNTQQRGGSQGQGTSEGLVGQATEAVRNVAESASNLAQDTYERGARYAREGWDRLPDADRYGRAISRPVEQNPVLAILAAGAVGYLLAYLIHGGGLRSIQEAVPDYARTRDRSRHSR